MCVLLLFVFFFFIYLIFVFGRRGHGGSALCRFFSFFFEHTIYEFSCQENVRNICSVVNHKLFTQSVLCGNGFIIFFFVFVFLFSSHLSSGRFKRNAVALAILFQVCVLANARHATIAIRSTFSYCVSLMVYMVRNEPHTKHDQIEPHSTQIDDVRTVSNAHM